MVVTSANDSQKSANDLLMTVANGPEHVLTYSWESANDLVVCKWHLQMVYSWVYQAFCGQKAQQNQPNTKKLKQPVLMKHVRWKKQLVLKSYMGWKRQKERASETANCISLQKRRYILCRKTLFTTKHKTLKRQKKAKRQHLKTMDCGLFFLLNQISFIIVTQTKI